MRASVHLALPAVPRELPHANTSASRSALSSTSAGDAEVKTSSGDEPAGSFHSILRQYRGTAPDNSNGSKQDGNPENGSAKQKGPVALNRPALRTQASHEIIPASEKSVSSSSVAPSQDQPDKPSTQKASDSQAAPVETPQVAKDTLPLTTKISAQANDAESSDDAGGSQASSDSTDESKKVSTGNGVEAAVAARPKETASLIATMPIPPVTSTPSSVTGQAQVAIPVEDASAPPAQDEPASSTPAAEPQPVAIAPMLDVSTTQTPSTAPIALAAKLTPIEPAEGNPPSTETADNRAHATSPVQKQASTTAAIPDDAGARPPADAAPEHLAKAETAFASVAAVSGSSPEAPAATRTAAAPGPSTSTEAASQMEPLIETQTPAATGSGHDITISLPDATERGMDLRFVERAGEVHVSIRTSDAEAAQTLRSGINDLTGRMEHAGMRAEVGAGARRRRLRKIRLPNTRRRGIRKARREIKHKIRKAPEIRMERRIARKNREIRRNHAGLKRWKNPLAASPAKPPKRGD